MSVRTQLADALKVALPKFDVQSVEKLPAVIKKPTLVVRHRDYTPAPNAQGTNLAGFSLSLVTPVTDIERSEDALDELWADFSAAAKTMPSLTWTRAAKSVYGEPAMYFGLEVQCSIPVNLNQ